MSLNPANQTMEKNQSYRASVGALIFDSNYRFLMIQITTSRSEEWGFVKGGMLLGEDEEDTLTREIAEEIGNDLEYQVLRQSSCNIIYTWDADTQIQKGYRGQARISFWVKFNSGSINIDQSEIRAYRWVNEVDLVPTLITSGWPKPDINALIHDWQDLKVELDS